MSEDKAVLAGNTICCEEKDVTGFKGTSNAVESATEAFEDNKPLTTPRTIFA